MAHLLTARPAGFPFAYAEDGTAIPVEQFLSDVGHVAAGLAGSGHYVLNVCDQRYHFMVVLAAAVATGRTTLMPPNRAPETLRRLADAYPDYTLVYDHAPPDGVSTLDIPALAWDQLLAGAPALAITADTECPDDLIAVIAFTSGSTGEPKPYPKTWAKLVLNGQMSAQVLQLPPRCTLVGTVPPQHMFGLESTLLLGWHGKAAIYAQRPFYPADIIKALGAVPEPLLVTTPLHLRTLLDDYPAGGPRPIGVLSATAPLPVELAERAEAMLGCPVREIYGCTESGQIATRRTVEGPVWQLLRSISIRQTPDGFTAEGDHIDGVAPLADRLKLLGDGRFILEGRDNDLVNIAGKRSSLSHLNLQLQQIPGVQDGAFWLPENADTPNATARLTAFVVAPGVASETIIAALRDRVDPVFLPRPLIHVDALPRSATGKLPRAALTEFAHQHLRTPPRSR